VPSVPTAAVAACAAGAGAEVQHAGAERRCDGSHEIARHLRVAELGDALVDVGDRVVRLPGRVGHRASVGCETRTRIAQSMAGIEDGINA
jgi:hypothetical protein